MGYYEELKAKNIIEAFKPFLQEGIIELRLSDGKLQLKEFQHIWDAPWVYHRPQYHNNCMIWGTLTYNGIIAKLPSEQRWVPSHCAGCYKVVVKPKTIRQLFELSHLQYALNLPSKCGIERRYEVFGLYGGYFYNRGLEEGRQCYAQVREVVSDMLTDGSNVPVILKRSCTEMETGCGPSDKWVVTKPQRQFEAEIEAYFVMNVPWVNQPHHLKEHVQQGWIREAYRAGDETVREFTDKPLSPQYVTYHEKEETI